MNLSPTMQLIYDATVKSNIVEILGEEFVGLAPGEHVKLQTTAPVTYEGLRAIYELGFRSGVNAAKE